jgi:7,8-dihydropterin-6-yl-methyl-4-(beta-D-ribofuranosyl)aminobenzene 5'-phosphate synthase
MRFAKLIFAEWGNMDVKLIVAGSRSWEHWFKYWGLSYVIDGTILYDTFANYPVLDRKLRKAAVDVSAIQTVVISHDHWDHVGGLWTILEKRPGIDVYLPPTALDEVKHHVVSAGGRLVDAPGIKTLKENVWVSDELMGSLNGRPVAEQSIIIKTAKGLIVLVGCSHPGIVAIIKKAKEKFGLPVYGMIGGLHLRSSSAEEIYACANALKNEGVQMVAPTHCTGWHAERIFKRVFGKSFISSRDGQTLSF